MAHVNSLGKIFGATLLAWGVAKLATRGRAREEETEEKSSEQTFAPVQVQPQRFHRHIDENVRIVIGRLAKARDWNAFNRSVDNWVDSTMSYEERVNLWHALG